MIPRKNVKDPKNRRAVMAGDHQIFAINIKERIKDKYSKKLSVIEKE